MQGESFVCPDCGFQCRAADMEQHINEHVAQQSAPMSNDAELRAREVLAEHAERNSYPLCAASIRKGDDPYFNRVVIEAMLAFAASERSHDGEWEAMLREANDILLMPDYSQKAHQDIIRKLVAALGSAVSLSDDVG